MAVLWFLVTVWQYLRFVLSLPLVFVALIAAGRLGDPFSDFIKLFSICKQVPGGCYFFSGCVGFFAPYTASIAPKIVSLAKDSCEVIMDDWPWLRNPFKSVHAIAQSNLAELASGLVMMSALQQRKDLRGIVTKIEMSYLEKGRGSLRALGTIEPLDGVREACVKKATANVYDGKGTLVATAIITWQLSLKTKPEKNDKRREKRT